MATSNDTVSQLLGARDTDLFNLHTALFDDADAYATETCRFLRQVLEYCTPLMFSSPQHRFYMALSEKFGALQEGGSMRVVFIGPQYDRRVGSALMSESAFLKGLCALMVDTEVLRGTLSDLCQVPQAVARAALFFKRNTNTDVFCLRSFFARRFFVANEEILEWMNPRLCSELHSPEYLDIVYMRFSTEEALHAAQMPDVLNAQAMCLNSVAASALNMSESVDAENRDSSLARQIWTFHVYFVHRMAQICRSTGSLSGVVRSLHTLFEPCVALLLGQRDAQTCACLAQVDSETLHNLAYVAEEFRAYMGARSDTVVPQLLTKLFRRTADFDKLYLSTLHAKSLVISTQAKPLALEPTYAPLRCEEFDRFYASLCNRVQVIQLRHLHACMPDLEVRSGARPTVWHLPANVRLYCAEWSLKMYSALAAEVTDTQRRPPSVVVGMDVDGAYVVTDRSTMHVLQMTMLAHALRTRCFSKKTAAYPLLARLYMLDYAYPDCHIDVNAFARNVFVQVLAYWLAVTPHTVLSSDGVPGFGRRLANQVLQQVHKVVAATRDTAARDEYAMLTCVRDFLVMRLPHWISIAALQRLYSATAELIPDGAAAGTPLLECAQLLRALLMHHEEHTNYPVREADAPAAAAASSDDSSQQPARRPRKRRAQDDTLPRIYTLRKGVVPLVAYAGLNLAQLLAKLPRAHPLHLCSSDADRLELINASLYSCILVQRPLLRHEFLAEVHTELAPLSAGTYHHRLYTCGKDVVDVWSEPELVRRVCTDAATPTQLYSTRADLASPEDQAELQQMFQVLCALERRVCHTNSGSRALQDEATAACLTRFYSAPTHTGNAATVPVSTYDDASGEPKICAFDYAICLVDVPSSTVVQAKVRQEIQAERRRFSTAPEQAAMLHDLSINVVGAMFPHFMEAHCERAELTSRTYDAVVALRTVKSYNPTAAGAAAAGAEHATDPKALARAAAAAGTVVASLYAQ